jgi:hypothetical protein
MSSDDTATILTALSNSRNELTKAIGDLHQEFSGFKGGMEARVTTIEKDQEKADRRQWVHSCIVFAGTLIHHDLGTWLHLRF